MVLILFSNELIKNKNHPLQSVSENFTKKDGQSHEHIQKLVIQFFRRRHRNNATNPSSQASFQRASMSEE